MLVARGELSNANALAGDDFSVRWTGQLLPPDVRPLRARRGRERRLPAVPRRSRSAERLGGERTRAQRRACRSICRRAGHTSCGSSTSRTFATPRCAWRGAGRARSRRSTKRSSMARAADVVVFVGGLTGDVEGEEMKVSYPGFAGGDRTDLRLPASQRKLLEALHATGKPVVLVLTAGSALAVDWAQAHAARDRLIAWYPGQRGGTAVADVLFGDVSPSGRLPVTFYKETEKLPPFDDYSMQGRTYRYFEGEPLYPFGHGLSYTRFEYSDLETRPHHHRERRTKLKSHGRSKNVFVCGAGVEVVQLYVHASTRAS